MISTRYVPVQSAKILLEIHNPTGTQVVSKLLALLFFPTPFCENRYQIMAALAERCCFFWRKTTLFKGLRAENGKICILHKIATAFLARIRGPPSEI